MPNLLFVLGAADPEMNAIEHLLHGHGVPFVHATTGGKRVYPANAYRAGMPPRARATLHADGQVYLVECVGAAARRAQRIDHHRPGDPGYGQPPVRYWQASSLGQTIAVLDAALLPDTVAVTPELRMVAAADHCLGAAYRGLCPGVDPDALFHWHLASRAAFLHQSESQVLGAIEAAQAALRTAASVELAPGILVADMRDRSYPELPLAAARSGRCCISQVTARDGRTKIGCLVGSPAEVESFMHNWAPAQRLTGIYGDAIRGFAGAYAQ
ncbi:MAG TPA: hypothetical protein VFQ95_03080 [Rhodanobacteraceae bacterium]|nr:hypothetical protein [Rhodanobacteraceae bacterium]